MKSSRAFFCLSPKLLCKIERTRSAAAEDGWTRTILRAARDQLGRSVSCRFYQSSGLTSGDASAAIVRYCGNSSFKPFITGVSSRKGNCRRESTSVAKGAISN